MRKSKGFSLIELIVAVGIVGLLSASLFVAIDPARRIADTQNAIRLTGTHAIEDAIKTYTAANLILPSSVNALTQGTYYLIAKDQSSGGQSGNCTALGDSITTVALNNDLVSTYISDIPIDPLLKTASTTNPYASGYYIKRTSGNVAYVGACYGGAKVTGSIAYTPANPSWNLGAVNFRIYESNSTTWGAGTLKCSATLTDDTTLPGTVPCTLTTALDSWYRVEFEVKNIGGTTLQWTDSGEEYITHHNACRFGAPALFAQPWNMSAVYQDFGGDDTLGVTPTPTVTSWCQSGGDYITVGFRADQVIRIAPGGKEGFAYVLQQGEPYGSDNALQSLTFTYNLGNSYHTSNYIQSY